MFCVQSLKSSSDHFTSQNSSRSVRKPLARSGSHSQMIHSRSFSRMSHHYFFNRIPFPGYGTAFLHWTLTAPQPQSNPDSYRPISFHLLTSTFHALFILCVLALAAHAHHPTPFSTQLSIFLSACKASRPVWLDVLQFQPLAGLVTFIFGHLHYNCENNNNK